MGWWCRARYAAGLAVHPDIIHRLDATEQPEIVITDAGSYSDIVYGLFAICGY